MSPRGIRSREAMQLNCLSYNPADGFSSPARELDSASTLVLVFVPQEYAHGGATRGRRSAPFPLSTVIGCSTAGEINGARGAGRHAVGRGRQVRGTRLAVASAPLGQPTDSERAAREVAAALVRGRPARHLRLGRRVDAPTGPRSHAVFAKWCPRRRRQRRVRGETGADSSGHGSSTAASLAAAAGRTRSVRCGVPPGPRLQERVGRLRAGTAGDRSDGNILYELDEKPALELYRTYLGDRAAGLAGHRVCSFRCRLAPPARRRMRHPDRRRHRRGPSAMRFAGELPAGHARAVDARQRPTGWCRARRRRATAREARTRPRSPCWRSPSVTRAGVWSLGERAEDEVEATLEALPPATAQVGFYSYGELSPPPHGGCDLHTQTMTLTTISEAA